MRSIFVGSNGVRAGWRFLLWFILGGILEAAIAIFVVLVANAGRVHSVAELSAATRLTMTSLGLLPAIALTWIFSRVFDGGGFREVGLSGPPRRALTETLLGLALGAALILLALGIAALGGGVTVHLAAASPGFLLFTVAAIAAASAKEELWFRGVPFQPFVRGIGAWPSIAIFAVIFGAMHLLNAGATAIGLANVMAAGVLLAIALLARGNLWFPIGLHAGWNLMQGVVLGIPVSGNTGFPSILETTLAGPDWRTGGSFGLEGSVGALLAVLAGIALLMPGFLRRPPLPARPAAAPASGIGADGDASGDLTPR